MDGHYIGGAMQALFGLDHRARSKAILPASILAQSDYVGRCAHRIVGGIELFLAIAVAVNEGGEIAPGERRLLVRNRIERQLRVGDDPLAITLRDGAVLFDPLSFQSMPAYARRGGADLVLRLQCNTLRSEEHTSELQSLMRTSYAVFCLKKKH